jgi:hypothetical protein
MGTIPPELGEGNDAEAEHHARSRKKQQNQDHATSTVLLKPDYAWLK